MILVAHPSLPVNSLREFIAYAKANPGQIDCSTGSSTFQFGIELLTQMTGITVNHVPYKGSVAAINAVVAGEVKAAMTDSKVALPHVRSGKLRGLGVTSAERSPFFPEIPTIAEGGVPDYELSLWIALFAPAGTPADIVSKLIAQVVRIANITDVREKMYALGVDLTSSTPERLADRIKRDIPKYRMLVKNSGIKLE